MKIGARIRQRRDELGMSGKQLGELVDRTEGMISQYESGQYLKNNLELLDKIAKELGRPLSWFLEDEPDTSPPPGYAQLDKKRKRALEQITNAMPDIPDQAIDHVVRTAQILGQEARLKKRAKS